MHIRIATLLLSGPDTAAVPSGPSGSDPALPADCVLLHHGGRPIIRLSGPRLIAAAKRARDCGATHLTILPGWKPSLESDLEKLVGACRAHPQALIVGRRPPVTAARCRRAWVERVWPRFWLKMQTGRHLDDPQSPLRVYPLAVIEHLGLYQRGGCLDTEILVKAAWADMAFREVAVADRGALPGGARTPLWEPVWRLLLNVHFTLRSVLPIPHRKLVPPEGPAGGHAISVWRPMRSLRTLLSENASPLQLALAAAMGVFLGTLPLIACHTLVIILAATYFRLNKLAALSASQLCMPPVVPALCIETGYWLRHGRFLTDISLETLGYQALERLYEWLLGALVLAPFLAGLIGGATLLLAHLAGRGMATVRNFKPTPENGAEH